MKSISALAHDNQLSVERLASACAVRDVIVVNAVRSRGPRPTVELRGLHPEIPLPVPLVRHHQTPSAAHTCSGAPAIALLWYYYYYYYHIRDSNEYGSVTR